MRGRNPSPATRVSAIGDKGNICKSGDAGSIESTQRVEEVIMTSKYSDVKHYTVHNKSQLNYNEKGPVSLVHNYLNVCTVEEILYMYLDV